MMPRMICQRWMLAVALGLAPAAGSLVVRAGERAIITAPAVLPPKADPSKKSTSKSPALPEFRTGSSSTPSVGDIAVPVVPSLDPKSVKQLRDKLEKEKDWLLDDTRGQTPDAVKMLEEAWDMKDPRAPRKSAIERKIRGKDSDDERDMADGRNEDRDSKDKRDRAPRRGNSDKDDEEEDFGSKKSDKDSKAFGAGSPRELNPFESAAKTTFGDRLGGQNSFLGKSDDVDSAFKKVDADYGARLERLGLGNSTDTSLKSLSEPTLRADSFGQNQRSRAEQFGQAMGLSSFSGVGTAASPAGDLTASFAKPTMASGPLFEKPAAALNDLIKPLSAPSLPAPSSRAMDSIRKPVSAFEPLSRGF